MNRFSQLVNDRTVDIDAKNQDGWSPLHMLCANYKHDDLEELIKPLIERGVNVNSRTPDGRNSLHILCGNYKYENLPSLLKILKEKNIELNAKTKQGWKPLHYLCRNYKHKNLIELIKLIDIDGDIFKVNENISGRMSYDEMFMTPEGSTPLQIILGYYTKHQRDLKKEDLTEILTTENGSLPLVGVLLNDRFHNNERLSNVIKILVENQNETEWDLHSLCRRHKHEILFDLLPRMVQNESDFSSTLLELREMCIILFVATPMANEE